jgi:nicotinamide riboside transporter PnuC
MAPKGKCNSRSLRDDNQEKQMQIQGFFAALRMTTYSLFAWKRTTATTEAKEIGTADFSAALLR